MKLPVFNQLIDVPRFTNTQLIKSESVSDHIWGMISLALQEVPKLNSARLLFNLTEVDLKEVIYRICLHDLDESISCDIPRPFKHFDQDIKNEISRVSRSLMENYGISKNLIDQIDESKHGCLEGTYVQIFDLIQCGLKMCNEMDLGNRLIKSELPNVISTLNELATNLDEIEKNYVISCVASFEKYL